MALQTWVGPLVTSQVDGPTVTNTTTATSILPTPAVQTIPSNYFFMAGQKLRIRAAGRISTVVTTPGTLTLDFRLGTLASPIVVFNGGAMALNIVAQVNQTWELDATVTTRTLGAATASTLIGVGSWKSRAVIGSAAAGAGGVGILSMPDTAPVAGTGFDSTITNVMNLFATWSIANAANSIICHDYSVESIL